MRLSFIIFFVVSLCFSSHAQRYTGGAGGGSAKAEVRTQIILSAEDHIDWDDNITVQIRQDEIQLTWNDRIVIQHIELVDILGKRCFFQENTTGSAVSFKLSFPNAIYILRLTDKFGRMYTKKIISN